MPTGRISSKGFAQPLMLLVALVAIGAGMAVFAGSKNLIGAVLGAKTRSENLYQNKASGVKVTVISPKSSWDLTEYLCDTKEQCERSATSGKWWSTLSGASTTEDGHEVFIEKAESWNQYEFLKIVVKEAGPESVYMSSSIGGLYYLYDLQGAGGLSSQVVFR